MIFKAKLHLNCECLCKSIFLWQYTIVIYNTRFKLMVIIWSIPADRNNLARWNILLSTMILLMRIRNNHLLIEEYIRVIFIKYYILFACNIFKRITLQPSQNPSNQTLYTSTCSHRREYYTKQCTTGIHFPKNIRKANSIYRFNQWQ